jgi:hypothetical protein
MADVERERVTALWREAAAALEPGDYYRDPESGEYVYAPDKPSAPTPCAECGRLREREQAAHGEGYDQAHDDVWEAPVCSVCGADHDADESAMCEGGEVVSFREWVEDCRRLREQLDALAEAAKPLANLPYPVSKDERTDWLTYQQRLRAALGVEGRDE